MLECLSPSRLTLFVRLSFAGFRVPEPTHLQGRLLAAGQAAVLVLLLLGGLHVDTALCLPVGPDVSELVSCEEALAVLPVQRVPPQDVVRKLRQDGGPLWITSNVLLQVIGIYHEAHYSANAAVPG